MRPNHTFISLGPTCVGAEILKAANLRRCTYGFDWFRSGSNHVKDFMELNLEEFLIKNVYYPNIPLMQSCDPNLLESNTSELEPCKTLYGYQYLYNPHRSYTNHSNLEYFRRCFERLKDFVSNTQNSATFLLADFPGTSHGSFLDETKQISDYLENLLSINCKCKFNLRFVRVSFHLPSSDLPSIACVNFTNISKMYYFTASSSIQDSDYMRKHLFSSIAKYLLREL